MMDILKSSLGSDKTSLVDLDTILANIFDGSDKDLVVTGIGSRETPADILALFTRIGAALEAREVVGRSGGAGGADLAFEAGYSDARGFDCIHPWHGFKPKIGMTEIDVAKALGRERPKFGPGAPVVLSAAKFAEACAITQRYHPAWHKCGDGARKLHTRNVPQVLGMELDRKADLIVCWTIDGKATGGTGQAMRIASDLGIPIVNLRNRDEREALIRVLGL